MPQPTNKSEKHIEQKLRRMIVKDFKGLCLKFVSPGMLGVPDRLILIPWRRIYLVETKSAVGDLSAIQRAVHKILAALGFPVSVVSNEIELQEFKEKLLNECP